MIIRDIKELTPRMQKKVLSFLDECKQNGVNCYVFESYRSQERQNELYAQGRTKPGRKVTWTLDSRHKQREAVDMAFGGIGKWTWTGPWEQMIEIAKKYGLESLAPREKAHLQDDGTEYNNNSMELKTDWFKLMEDEVASDALTVGHNYADKKHDEEQLRAMVELMMDRKVKQIIKKLQ